MNAGCERQRPNDERRRSAFGVRFPVLDLYTNFYSKRRPARRTPAAGVRRLAAGVRRLKSGTERQ